MSNQGARTYDLRSQSQAADRLQAEYFHTSLPPTTSEQLRTDPLAIWTEQTFRLWENDEGRLARQLSTGCLTPRQPWPIKPASTARCEQRLRELLLAGSRACDEQGRPLFAFKLHLFIGEGDTAYATLERPEKRCLRC